MAFIAAALPAISAISSIGGTVLSAAGAIQQGKAANEAAKQQAAQEQRAANEKRAQSSMEVAQRLKEQQLVLSNQQAAAGASGGGASDPTILDLAGDVGGYGYQQRALAVANGENQARGYEDQRKSTLASGKSALSASYTNAFGSLLSGTTSGLSTFRDMMPKKTSFGSPNYTYGF